jgi:predicted AlkP superfamily pyrophosphatase or phosphodiesterase
VARYDSYVQFAYQTANNAVQRIIDTVGTDVSGVPNSNVIVVSDHGFSPFHTSVNINNLLANAGFNTNQVRAIISGPATNIYINLQGREPNGVVAPADYPALQKRIIETLQGFVDTNPNYTGGSAVPIFDKVYNRVGPGSPIPQTVFEASLLKQANQFIGQDTGDVFALLGLGYNFDGTQTPVVPRRSDASSSSPVLSLPSFYGAHGFDPTLPEMQAIFFAAGPDFGRGNVGSVRNIDVAPTINNILKVNPAATVEGKAIKS